MKSNEIEIPFGAKDSELIESTYHIPDGMEAIIEDDKVIIRKKESEDEKIRKEIISLVLKAMGREKDNFNDENYDKMLDWLEKQSKENMIEALRMEYEKGKSDVLQEQRKEWSEEDERIRKSLIHLLQVGGYMSKEFKEKVFSWLEKQHTDPYNGVCFDCYGHHWAMCARDNGIEIAMDGTPVRQFSYKDCEQTFGGKSALEAIKEERVDNANKVESKFKEGDWVVTTYGKVSQIISVDKDGDGYTLDDGVYFSGSWCDMYHLWSIEDAKEGDIIYIKRYKNNSEWLLIFKKIKSQNNFIDVYDYYAFSTTTDNVYYSSVGCWGLLYDEDIVRPATKEQCNILLTKMKEAGYEWDVEKKELKKISQEYPLTPDECVKPAWSEEDEYTLYETIQHLEELIRIDKAKHCACDVQYYQRDIDWLKSLKERIKNVKNR